MYKIVIWGLGVGYDKYVNLIKYYESQGAFRIEAVTSKEDNIIETDGYKFVPKEQIHNIEFDYCIVTMSDFSSAINEAANLRIVAEKLIPVRVLSIPYFDFNRYILVKKSNPSIISKNCWAGICYNYLGIKFLSPTINMFFYDAEFNRFLKNIKYYLSLPVEYECSRYDANLKRDYPVCRLGDISLNFNHYTDYDSARESWNRRLKRINWDNLFVVSATTSIAVAEEFEQLPYEKKLIFVPFQNDLKSNVYIPYYDKKDGVTIGMQSNAVARGNNLDLLRFLHYEDMIFRKKYR